MGAKNSRPTGTESKVKTVKCGPFEAECEELCEGKIAITFEYTNRPNGAKLKILLKPAEGHAFPNLKENQTIEMSSLNRLLSRDGISVDMDKKTITFAPKTKQNSHAPDCLTFHLPGVAYKDFQKLLNLSQEVTGCEIKDNTPEEFYLRLAAEEEERKQNVLTNVIDHVTHDIHFLVDGAVVQETEMIIVHENDNIKVGHRQLKPQTIMKPTSGKYQQKVTLTLSPRAKPQDHFYQVVNKTDEPEWAEGQQTLTGLVRNDQGFGAKHFSDQQKGFKIRLVEDNGKPCIIVEHTQNYGPNPEKNVKSMSHKHTTKFHVITAKESYEKEDNCDNNYETAYKKYCEWSRTANLYSGAKIVVGEEKPEINAHLAELKEKVEREDRGLTKATVRAQKLDHKQRQGTDQSEEKSSPDFGLPEVPDVPTFIPGEAPVQSRSLPPRMPPTIQAMKARPPLLKRPAVHVETDDSSAEAPKAQTRRLASASNTMDDAFSLMMMLPFILLLVLLFKRITESYSKKDDVVADNEGVNHDDALHNIL